MPVQLYDYDKNSIKQNLDINQVADYVAELGGEPQYQGNTLVCKTICHCGSSHKLYYFDNTQLFHCFTDCGTTFDIFELTKKVNGADNENYQLPQAVKDVANYFNLSAEKRTSEEEVSTLKDWKIFNSYNRIKSIDLKTQNIELKEYSDNIIKNLSLPRIDPWLKDGICMKAMQDFEIRYEPMNSSIIIPHRDINNRLIGIRARTLVEEMEKYGKYRPLRISGTMFNHPLGFNLYGLNKNKDKIKAIKKAIVLESEKSVLQYATMFGQENNITVAICGSNLISYQVQLLLSLGIEELIVGLDRQYQELGDDEHNKLVKNLKNIHNKYGNRVKISYLFDKENLLPYKASPTDVGKEVFIELFKKRIDIY